MMVEVGLLPRFIWCATVWVVPQRCRSALILTLRLWQRARDTRRWRWCMSAAEVEFLLHQQPLQMLPACYLGQAGERAGQGRGRAGGRRSREDEAARREAGREGRRVGGGGTGVGGGRVEEAGAQKNSKK